MNTGTEKRDRLLRMIHEGLAGVRHEIEKAKAGADALDCLQQLRFVEVTLLEMQEVLRRDDWRSCLKSKPGIARIVVDTWPMDDPLGKVLTQIEYEYERLK